MSKSCGTAIACGHVLCGGDVNEFLVELLFFVSMFFVEGVGVNNQILWSC